MRVAPRADPRGRGRGRRRASAGPRAAAAPTASARATRALIGRALPRAETKDADYVFISFVMANLPAGLVGLLLAVIFCAAMSSTASELTALGQCTRGRLLPAQLPPRRQRRALPAGGQAVHGGWGVLAVVFAASASLIDNLIQAVNILGSLFYGTILGIFLVAFFVRRVRGTRVFVAALISEVMVLRRLADDHIGFLWFNVIGCAAVLLVATGLNFALKKPLTTSDERVRGHT